VVKGELPKFPLEEDDGWPLFAPFRFAPRPDSNFSKYAGVTSSVGYMPDNDDDDV
jgi:hypothetical protein